MRVTGVGRESIQGDVAFADVLAQLGADVRFGTDWIEASAGTTLHGGTIDCVAIPDAAMTLAMTALFADSPTTLTNIGSWRVKETDRIAAMATELAKLGVTVASGDDWLRVEPPPKAKPLKTAAIDTYDDHRMAMCFSLATLRRRAGDDQRPGLRAQDLSRLFRRVRAHRPMTARRRHCRRDRRRWPGRLRQGNGGHRRGPRPGFPLPRQWIAVPAGRAAGLADRHAADDATGLARLAADLDATFGDDGTIALAGQDATDAIRTEEVSAAASQVAVHPAVRAALFGRQRAFRRPPGLVADGRDMGSVVFPDARVKVFVTASAEERARRRHKQLIAKGISVTMESLVRDIRERDERDEGRAAAPLKHAPDASDPGYD